MEQSSKHTRRLQIIFWVAVISSWLTFLFFISIPFGVLIWIGALIYLFISHTKLKWYLLLFSTWTIAPIWNFALGSKDYFQGKATIRTFGMPDREFYNLDPDLRAWNSTSGCVVMGVEPFTQAPNNWAVRFWTSLLGTQNGVYKGIYPTKDQAKAMIQQGEQVQLSKLADTFFIRYKNEPLFFRSNNYYDLDILKKATATNAFVLNDQCLLVEPIGDTTKRVIILADKSNGNVFARYYDYQIR
jgi:hypothetical protein